MTYPPLTEDELIAYFEDALPPDARARIETRLATDPQAQATLLGWSQQNADIRALYGAPGDDLDNTPVPAHLSAALHTRPPARAHPLRAAVVIGLLALGGATGWFGHAGLYSTTFAPIDGQTLAQAAISAHDTYVVEVVHPVEVPATQRDHMDTWMSKRMGTRLSPPDLGSAGFVLMGGRILPSDSGPAGLYMYENADGQRITLYVSHQQGHDTAFRFAGEDATQSLLWSDRGLGYALTGAMPRERLREMAKTAYDQLL